MKENFENLNILIVDDDEKGASLLQYGLSVAGKFNSETTSTGEKAIEKCLKKNYDAVLLDLNLPGIDGFTALEKIKSERPYLPVIITTGHNEIQSAVKAIKLGALDYLIKPLDLDLVINTLERAFEQSSFRKKDQAERERERISEANHIICAPDSPMQNIMEMGKKVAVSDSSVLINGQSGTGKELLAKMIHTESKRANQPFIEVNCGAIPPELMESEFFGHIKGAYTGAHETKEGLFSIANKGTIFLDEVGEMPLSLQVKLLRTLQSGEVRKVGSTKLVHVDVRVVAATSKNLENEVQQGNFREDLFYRLNVINIILPPLKERTEDIPLLINHFLKTLHIGTKQIGKMEEKALKRLMQYSWPGNIRELKNTIERLMLLCEGDKITYEDVTADYVIPKTIKKEELPSVNLSLSEIEADHIKRVLEKCKGNKTHAAKILGITVQTLYNKLAKFEKEGLL